jgi:hypothetical protein
MLRVKTKFQLKDSPTDSLVFVETIKKLYQYIDGGWVEKKYFTTEEVADIFSLPTDRVRRTLKTFGLVARYEQTRITYPVLTQLRKIISMRKQKLSQTQIKKQLYGK